MTNDQGFKVQTKKELLEVAASMNIVGRHDMVKEDLLAAIEEINRAKFEEGQGIEGNYVPTKPWVARVYGVAPGDRVEEVYAKLPPQAKQMFDFMEQTGFKGLGQSVAKATVEAGRMKTKQDMAILFAFYARRLEEAGMKLVATH